MTISSLIENRPFKLGTKDRREYIVSDGELSIRTVNDANGNALNIGKAIAGTGESEFKWQISEQTYDAQNALLDKKWAVNPQGNASTNYEFSWDDVGTLSYA